MGKSIETVEEYMSNCRDVKDFFPKRKEKKEKRIEDRWGDCCGVVPSILDPPAGRKRQPVRSERRLE
jgi:hypothetical protein